MLNEAEDRKKLKDKEGGIGQENEKVANQDLDLERDDDSMEFAFEDAIDQPLDEEDFKTADSGKSQEQLNFDQIIEKIENPKNVKKSFELRY